MRTAPATVGLRVARYVVFDEIAAGGMASVHLARMAGDEGFERVVAVKRLHPAVSRDREIATMLLDEARVASRVRHPNVVTTLDVVNAEGEVFLVMEYVHGVALSRLLALCRARRALIPPRIVATILHDALEGLHAAHEAQAEDGHPLELVHRDVSPQNVLVGVDGVARIADFGIAKARNQAHVTATGDVRGKLRYMAPEQLAAEPVTRASDIYAMGIVLWEALTGEALFGSNGADVASRIAPEHASRRIEPPTALVPDLDPGLDALVLRALARDPRDRPSTARELATSLTDCVGLATRAEVSAWLTALAGDELADRERLVRDVERRPLVPSSPAPALDGWSSRQLQRGRGRAAAIAAAAAGIAISVALLVARRPPNSVEARTAPTPEPSPPAAVVPAPEPSSTASAAALPLLPVPSVTPRAPAPPRAAAPQRSGARGMTSGHPRTATSTPAHATTPRTVDEAFGTRR